MIHSLKFVLAFYLTASASSSIAANEIQLHIDATDAPRKRLTARMSMPVKPGPLTLYYPKWIAGEHGPTGPITDLTGIKIHGNAKAIPWKRDDVDTFAINLDVPEGVSRIEVDVEFIGTPSKDGFSAAASMTPRLAILYWNQVLLYPKGSVMQETKAIASLTLPKGWKVGCSLPIEEEKNGRITFKPVTLEMLCDSPFVCGRHYREMAIGPNGAQPHYLCMAADSEEALNIPDDLKANYDRLISEAHMLFGARPYRSYRFLVTLSDHVSHFGLEHHESSDNRMPERAFIDASYRKTWHAWLLSHEYVHSWNGKYRRPAGMVVEDFQKPVRTKMLWVYEGLTQYLGLVLAARSGLWTPELSRDNFAHVAEWSKNQTGRDWRSLEDTATAAQHLYNARSDGASRRRSVDFYDEGALIWLDADTLIREKTKGEKSLDDFCRVFHGGKETQPQVKPYDFEEIVKFMNGIVAHDWKTFFEKRVMQAGAPAPIEGITRGGWKLAYSGSRTDGQYYAESDSRQIDLCASIGLILKDDGTVVDVIPLKPADKAGVAAGMKLLAVNGRRWTVEGLRSALAATKESKGIDMLFEHADFYETLKINYGEGEKYPKLELIPKSRDILSEILGPRVPIESSK